MKFFNKALVLSVVASLVGVAGAAELKVATVDVQKVFKDYYRTHEAQKVLDGSRVQVQEENKKRIEKIQEIETALGNLKKQIEDPSTSDTNKKKLEGEFQVKSTEAVALDQERRGFLDRKNRALGELMKAKMTEIVGEINKVAEDKARENGYDLVIDKSGLTFAQTKVVLYAKDSLEITDTIIKVLNADAPEGFDPNKAPTVPMTDPAASTATPAE